jgi:hypothetical protein
VVGIARRAAVGTRNFASALRPASLLAPVGHDGIGKKKRLDDWVGGGPVRSFVVFFFVFSGLYTLNEKACGRRAVYGTMTRREGERGNFFFVLFRATI